MTKRKKLEKDIRDCLDNFKDYDITYTALLMYDLHVVKHVDRITKDIEARVKTRISTLQQLKALALLKKEMERK